MKALTFAYLAILSMVYLSAIAQTDKIEGKIVDEKTNEPIPFVNIGVIGKNIGTISNENGEFKINLNSIYNNDSLRFSMVAYKSKTFRVADFKNKYAYMQPVIALQENTVQLREVVVFGNNKLNTRTLGNKTVSKSILLGLASNELGSEVGIVIKIKKAPTYIERFNFSIARNEFDSLFFRLNIYDLKNGKPNENILRENIFINTDKKQGSVSVNLAKYNIIVEDDFLVTLEWIKDLGSTDGLYFSAGFLNGGIWYRKTSQANWERVKGIGLGLNVTVKY